MQHINSKIMKKFFLGILSFLFAATGFAKVSVVATTPDFGALAMEIGGDKVEVFTVAKPTEDPHFVDARPSFVVKLNRADALVEGGAELELGWLPPLLDKARNKKLDAGKPGRIVALEGVQLLEVPAVLDRSKGDIHAAGNPHYTTDPLNGKIVAEHIANAFSQLDPKSASVFKANLKKFNDRIDAKMQEWQKALASYKDKRIVAYHNAWPYSAKRFDLRIDLFLEPKPGIPPSPSHLAEVVSTMKTENIKLILVEPHRDRRYAETVASHTDAVVLDVAPYPKKADETYEDWMDGFVKSIVKAFESKK
jgi:zinc/manganese transport system substrate-binding protein